MSLCEKLRDGTYLILDSPKILILESGELFVNKYAPNLDDTKAFEDQSELKNLVKTEKLITCKETDFVQIGSISSRHFTSREEFDSIFLECLEESEFSNSYGVISMTRVFHLLCPDVKCNMKYYENNKDELERDLNRKLDYSELENLEKLEQELFFHLMHKWFGNDCKELMADISMMDDKQFWLKDFRICTIPGFRFASAQIKDKILVFQCQF